MFRKERETGNTGRNRRRKVGFKRSVDSVSNSKPRKRAKVVRKKFNNPPTAYALFIQEVRNRLFDRKITFTELSRNCAQRWKQMTDQQKQRFYTMADQRRQSMLETGGKARRGPKKDGSKKKMTCFWNFAQLERPKVLQQMKESVRKPRMKDVNKEVGRRWRQLPDEVKHKYRNLNAIQN